MRRTKSLKKQRRIGKPFNPYRLFYGSIVPEPLERLPTGQLSQGAKLAYGRLMRYAGKDGDCFPSEATLGTALGVSEKQARNYIRALTLERLIAKRQRGLRQTNVYKFLWHPLFAQWLEEKQEKKLNPDRKSVAGQKRSSSASDRNDTARQARKESDDQERKYDALKENHRNQNHWEESHKSSKNNRLPSLQRSVPVERRSRTTQRSISTGSEKERSRSSSEKERSRSRTSERANRATPLPRGTKRSAHTSVAAVQDVLFSEFGEQLGYPDIEIAERILTAAQGAPAERISSILQLYASAMRARKKPEPRSYGFFLTHLGRYFDGHPNARRPFQSEDRRRTRRSRPRRKPPN
jgi:hypothetical protein